MSDVKRVGPIPQMGFGTWKRDGSKAYDCVQAALDVGYRHIDTAEGYNNEEFVGNAIAKSDVDRKDIFLTTKIAPESFAPGQMMQHAKASLEKLQTAQVDLLLLHYPSIDDEYDVNDYVTQFAEIYDEGLTRYIGVSNFTKRHITQAMQILGERKLLTNQVEIHAFLQNRPIVDYCIANQISMTAYCPLARGAVSNNEQLKKIAARHGVTPEQVALAFLMAEGYIVIPSSGNPQRIAQNFDAKDLPLDADEMVVIRGLDAGERLVDGPWCPTWDV